jgi:multidrug efflux system membrane fusion protein
MVSALLALCSSASWVACNRADSSSPAAIAGQTMPVTVAAVETGDVPYYLTGLGSVTAFYTVSVKSRVDGELQQVNVKEGQTVRQGELLAVIDPRPYQVQLEQAQAQLFRDQASLRDAQLNLERYRGLLESSGAMSQQQVDTQSATVDQFEGTVKTDQAAIDTAKLQLIYCHITSPINARVGLRQVDPGNIVHAADTNPMLILTQLQPITVIFTLPEDNLPAVARYMAKGPLAVTAYSRDDETQLATGKLLTIDNQIDQTTGTGKLKAVFDNRDNALWPNQFVNVRLLLNTRKNATFIPAAAVERGPDNLYVFVVRPDKTVDLRPVTIGFTQNNLSVVDHGLAPNEVVVTDGQDKLQAGASVEPRSPSVHAQTQDARSSTPPAPSRSTKRPGGERPKRASSTGGAGSGNAGPGQAAQ